MGSAALSSARHENVTELPCVLVTRLRGLPAEAMGVTAMGQGRSCRFRITRRGSPLRCHAGAKEAQDERPVDVGQDARSATARTKAGLSRCLRKKRVGTEV